VTYLQQLVESRPPHERYPTHAWPVDSEPWSGNEAGRFARIYCRARIVAAVLRDLRDVEPGHEAVKTGRMMLTHFAARVTALLESWQPQSPAVN
jgi:hypothetical protein